MNYDFIKENRPLDEMPKADTQGAVKIFAIESKLQGKSGYRWAWKESYDKKVFGWATSLDEVVRRAKKMFPNSALTLKII